MIGSKRLDDLADAARSIEGINIAITNPLYNSLINMGSHFSADVQKGLQVRVNDLAK